MAAERFNRKYSEEIIKLISKIKFRKGSEFVQLFNSVKLVNMISPGFAGDLSMFRLLIQCDMDPEYALTFTHGPQSKECKEMLLNATEPEHGFGDYWDEWMNDPDRFDEERENRLFTDN